ncbi:MAG: SurA N-terminal domain-containing protein, partial [Betaproteobacteria bacterium]
MYDFIHRHKRILQIVLAVLIVPPFALFGMDWYFRGDSDGGNQVAQVGGSSISQREFSEALRQRQEQMRQMMGGKVDQATLDSPEVRRAVLDQLINERLMYTAALKSGMSVSSAELKKVIGDIPAFKDGNGAFSSRRYSELLRSQGMSEPTFEALMRKDMILGRNRDAVAATAFLPNTVLDRLMRLRQQQREVNQYVLEPAQFVPQIKITDAEAKTFYEAHKAEFEQPERVKLQYVMLTLDGLQKQIVVTPEEVQQYFKERSEQLQKPEERRASHILISVPAGATAEQKAAARTKAEALAAEVKKKPAAFAELAKKNSQDPGSAAEGGDLGFFTRGKMVKPFDEAVFAMKSGDIVGPVETPFGYHIIRLDQIKATEGPNFETLKPTLEDELRKTKASKLFAQDAE